MLEQIHLTCFRLKPSSTQHHTVNLPRGMPSLSGDFLQHSKIVRNSNWVQLLTTCKKKAFFYIRNRLNVFLTNYFRHLTEVDSVGLQSTNAMNHYIATWNEWKFGRKWNTEVSLLSNKKLIRILPAPNVNLIIPSRWTVTLKYINGLFN